MVYYMAHGTDPCGRQTPGPDNDKGHKTHVLMTPSIGHLQGRSGLKCEPSKELPSAKDGQKIMAGYRTAEDWMITNKTLKTLALHNILKR
jgi:hypothetical protein